MGQQGGELCRAAANKVCTRVKPRKKSITTCVMCWDKLGEVFEAVEKSAQSAPKIPHLMCRGSSMLRLVENKPTLSLLMCSLFTRGGQGLVLSSTHCVHAHIARILCLASCVCFLHQVSLTTLHLFPKECCVVCVGCVVRCLCSGSKLGGELWVNCGPSEFSWCGIREEAASRFAQVGFAIIKGVYAVWAKAVSRLLRSQSRFASTP